MAGLLNCWKSTCVTFFTGILFGFSPVKGHLSFLHGIKIIFKNHFHLTRRRKHAINNGSVFTS